MPDEHDRSLQLVIAAAGASGAAPADPLARAEWLKGVTQLAVDLFRAAGEVDPELAILDQVVPITGVIADVQDQSGRAVIHLRPTMGGDRDKLEDLRTPWLNEPKGAAMAQLARSLIGRNCRFGKWVEVIDGGARKVRMCAWIEPIGDTAPTAQPTAPTAESAARTADTAEPRNQTAEPRESAPPAQEAPPQRPTPPPGDTSHVERFEQLRRLAPATTQDVLRLADEHLGLGDAQVKDMAKAKLAPLAQGGTRTADECTTLWLALCDAVEPF